MVGPSAYLETSEDWQDLDTGDELVKEEREILACLQCGGETGLAGALVLLLHVQPGQQEILPGPDHQTVAQAVQVVLQGVHHDIIPGRHITVTRRLRLLIKFCSHRNNELQLQHAQRVFLTRAVKSTEIFSNLNV